MNNVIIALDFPNKDQVNTFLEEFDVLEDKPYLKVGMELFYLEGISYIKELKKRKYKIFLDLKLFDIPQTVYNSIYNILSNVDVDIINVHALGGIEMLLSAKKAILDSNSKAKLIAVTLLTSIDVQSLKNELLVKNDFYEFINNLISISYQAKLDGVVCSAQDLKFIEKPSEDFLFVTPGIRINLDDINDQKRVSTPQNARKNGSTHIVVGRPIKNSSSPLKKYKKINILFNKK